MVEVSKPVVRRALVSLSEVPVTGWITPVHFPMRLSPPQVMSRWLVSKLERMSLGSSYLQNTHCQDESVLVAPLAEFRVGSELGVTYRQTRPLDMFTELCFEISWSSGDQLMGIVALKRPGRESGTRSMKFCDGESSM